MGGAEVERRVSWGKVALAVGVSIPILALAMVGTTVLVADMKAPSGPHWTPAAVRDALLQTSGMWPSLQDAKDLLHSGAIMLGAIAALAAVSRAKVIARILRDFLEARGPLYSLFTSVNNLQTVVPKLEAEINRLAKLEPTIQATAEKIEEALKQIADLQRLQVSERTDTAVDPTPSAGVATAAAEADPNWERLRELWNANGQRLDAVIAGISDGRRRSRFLRMPKTNYPAIINALADDKYISEAARNASIGLHSTFMRFKPRKRPIPDQAIIDLVQLDLQLDHEFAKIAGRPTEPPATPPVETRQPESA